MAANLNALDRVIGWISPRAGLERARARAALGVVRSYDGATKGRRTAGWISGQGSANAEIGPALSALRSRSRDLLRNNPYAVKACSAWVGNAVGTGITAKFDAPSADLWARWVNECDADGNLDFFGLQALVARTEFESGECLVRLRWRRPDDGLAVPLQLQVLEPDYLDNLKNEALANGGWILNGIEFDPLGRRVAYWLFPEHPGEAAPYLKSLVSKRVPASEILHIYQKARPGQVRGVPRLTPALLKLRDLDDYEEAELVRKGVEACFAAFVTSADAALTLGAATSEDARRIETLGAGQIQYLRPGESVTFGSPSGMSGYNEFIRQQLHAIAAGVGLTYELLTGDLSAVNYSSIRAGTLEFRRTVEQFQWLAFIPQFCAPVAAAFQAGVLMQTGKKPGPAAAWTPPKWDWVDPVKDITGELLEVAAGLSSWQEAVRRRGLDPDKVLKEIAADQAAMEAAGVSIQIDKVALGAGSSTLAAATPPEKDPAQ